MSNDLAAGPDVGAEAKSNAYLRHASQDARRRLPKFYPKSSISRAIASPNSWNDTRLRPFRFVSGNATGRALMARPGFNITI
jgi:hypothetical protein